MSLNEPHREVRKPICNHYGFSIIPLRPSFFLLINETRTKYLVTEVSLSYDKRTAAFRNMLPDQKETMAHVLRSVRHLENHLCHQVSVQHPDVA